MANNPARNVRFDEEEINLKTFENDNFKTQSNARMVKTLAPHASTLLTMHLQLHTDVNRL